VHFFGSHYIGVSQYTVQKMSKILNICVTCYWYFIPQSHICKLQLTPRGQSVIHCSYTMNNITVHKFVQHIILHVPNVLAGYVYLICDAVTSDWMSWFLSWSGWRATELPRLSRWRLWM